MSETYGEVPTSELQAWLAFQEARLMHGKTQGEAEMYLLSDYGAVVLELTKRGEER